LPFVFGIIAHVIAHYALLAITWSRSSLAKPKGCCNPSGGTSLTSR
jgi:hypothetical protein